MNKRKLVILPVALLSIGFLSSCSDNGISSRFDDLQSQINDIKTEISDLKTQIANLKKEMADADAAIKAEYDGKISEINKSIASLNTELENLNKKYQEDKEALTNDYTSKINNLKEYTDGKIAELKAALELDYNTKISNLTTTYQAKVAEIEGSIATCNSNISTLQTEMNKAILDNQNDYNAKINALTGRVAALETTTYHTVTFDVVQGSAVENQIIEHGEKVTEPVNPTRPGFTFEGWTYNGKPWVFYGYVVTEDMTLTANWEYIDYTVTFKNDDGTILETQEKVHYGDSVTYHGDIPVKPNPVDHYIYIFNGWDVDITNITGDTVATAQYTSEYAPFTANFYDEEDNLLYSTYVKEGETAVYPLETPTKADDNENKLQFQFSGWDEISRTSDTVNYKVHFESCTKGLVFEQGKVYQYTGSALNVVIPSYWNGNRIVEIGEASFEKTTVVSISIPDGVKTIGNRAFNNCTSLETINVPNTVVTIGSEAFSTCQKIESIIIPDSVVSIGYQAFWYCIKLKSIQLLADLSTIEDGLFYANQSLESITIPDKVTSIGNNAFGSCSSITSINIPKSVTSIGMYAFSLCYGLKTVFVPISVTSMGEYVFGYIPDITILVESENKPLGWNVNWATGAFVIWGYKSKIVKDGYTYALSMVDDEPIATLIYFDQPLADFNPSTVIEGYTLKYVNMSLFKENKNIKTVVLPDCVTSIPDNCFLNCTLLESVFLPNTIKTIGEQAFSGCSILEAVNIPDGVVSIGFSAFSRCHSLISVEIPESVISIGAGVFDTCESLKTVILHDNLSSITDSMFSMCTSLTSITIPDTIKAIGDSAFDRTSLTYLNLGSGTETVGQYAFYYCAGLQYVVVPISLSFVGDNAFDYCSGLNKVFYMGTEEQWNQIGISYGNSYLKDAMRYYFSELEPVNPGNYWHYVEGVPTVW